MADLVYILGHQDEYEELRYSLRSIKWCAHDNVWIVGAPPPRWSTGLNYLPVQQVKDQKLANQRNNIYQACLSDEISDEFILMNDDFIFLYDPGPLPIIHSGPMVEHRTYRDYHDTGYKPMYDWFIENGFENPWYYSEHRAMTMRSDLMAEVHERVQHIERYPVPTAYGNYARLDGEMGEDATYDLGRNGIWKPDEWQVSTFENDFHTMPYGELIRLRLPEPSIYEKS